MIQSVIAISHHKSNNLLILKCFYGTIRFLSLIFVWLKKTWSVGVKIVCALEVSRQSLHFFFFGRFSCKDLMLLLTREARRKKVQPIVPFATAMKTDSMASLMSILSIWARYKFCEIMLFLFLKRHRTNVRSDTLKRLEKLRYDLLEIQ